MAYPTIERARGMPIQNWKARRMNGLKRLDWRVRACLDYHAENYNGQQCLFRLATRLALLLMTAAIEKSLSVQNTEPLPLDRSASRILEHDELAARPWV